jgi:hypothetical protein
MLQLKVFMGTPEEVCALANTYEEPRRSEGIVCKHPRKREFCALLDELYKGNENVYEDELQDAEWVLLSIKDEQLLKVIPHSLNIEDEDDPDEDLNSLCSSHEG